MQTFHLPGSSVVSGAIGSRREILSPARRVTLPRSLGWSVRRVNTDTAFLQRSQSSGSAKTATTLMRSASRSAVSASATFAATLLRSLRRCSTRSAARPSQSRDCFAEARRERPTSDATSGLTDVSPRGRISRLRTTTTRWRGRRETTSLARPRARPQWRAIRDPSARTTRVRPVRFGRVAQTQEGAAPALPSAARANPEQRRDP